MPHKKNRTAAFWLVALMLGSYSLRARAQYVVALPSSLYLDSLAGNTNSSLPFAYWSPFTVRYQQVYDASQFLTIANGTTNDQNYFSAITNGGWISDVYFRGIAGSGSFFATVSNVEIHLSTTPRTSGGLSQVFIENTGPDDTVVFSGSFTVGGDSMGLQPYAYDHVVLSKNFWYDPRVGNLLLDVRLYQGIGAVIPPFDAVDFGGDSVSRIYAISTNVTSGVNATSGTTDTTGLVTFFAMAPLPVLQAYMSNAPPTNAYIVLGWYNQPTGFVLQGSTSMGSSAFWSTLLGVDTNVDYRHFVYSVVGQPVQFFRLARP